MTVEIKISFNLFQTISILSSVLLIWIEHWNDFYDLFGFVFAPSSKKTKKSLIKIMKILNFVIHVQQLYAHTHAIHMNYSDLTYLILNIHICSRSHEVSFKDCAISSRDRRDPARTRFLSSVG